MANNTITVLNDGRIMIGDPEQALFTYASVDVLVAELVKLKYPPERDYTYLKDILYEEDLEK